MPTQAKFNFEDPYRKCAHLPNLLVINKQLRAERETLQKRFRCLGFLGELDKRCSESAQGFPLYHPVMMRSTSEALKKTEVSDVDFVTIVRSIFCGYHDTQPLNKHWNHHLQQLWRKADAATQIDFREAIGQGHKDIFKYYASLEKDCHADDIEDAIKTEQPISEVGNESQLIAYETQHTLLARLRERSGLQAMYRESVADDCESSIEPDAATFTASKSTVSTPPHVNTDIWQKQFDLFKPWVHKASNIEGGRDNGGHTSESMTSGSGWGQNPPAQVSAVDTPTPLAKRVGLPETEQDPLPGSYHQESSGPKQTPTPIERPTHAATPPTQRGVPSPGKPLGNKTPGRRGPRKIAGNIRKILREPIEYTNDGYIYVLKAPQFFDQFPPSRDLAEPEHWVKIGITRSVEDRMENLKRRCGIEDLEECERCGMTDLDEGEDPEPMPMPELRRVERLCHQELSDFQRPFDCKQTGTLCETLHQEWFNVTEEVAIRTVKRWLRFFSKKPYTVTGTIESRFWDDKVSNGEYLKTRKDEDPDRTHQRYQSWLENSIQQYETMVAEEELGKLSVGSQALVH